MTKKICFLTIPLIAALGIGCSSANDTTNANTAAPQAQATTAPGPDNSEISTSVDASGTRTDTRTFRDNPRIQKVVVTTKDGKRTVKVTSRSGEEKVVDTTENVLEATGGRTYAEMGRYLTATGEETDDEAEAATDENGNPVSNGLRNLWVTATSLTTALNTAFLAERIALFSIVMGVALLLTGIGFLVLTISVFLRPSSTIASE